MAEEMSWLAIAIEEYKTLREESLTSMQTQQSILRLGSATVGLVLIAGFNFWEKIMVPELIFLLFVPLLCYLVLLIWIGEIARMMRAGVYLKNLEDKINKHFPGMENPLSWENYLRQPQADGNKPQLLWNYLTIIAMYFILPIASISIGNYKIQYLIDYKCIINLAEFLGFAMTLFLVYKQGKSFR